NVGGLYRAMARRAADEPLRARLATEGPRRAAAFSWTATAHATLDAIEDATHVSHPRSHPASPPRFPGQPPRTRRWMRSRMRYVCRLKRVLEDPRRPGGLPHCKESRAA